MENALQDKVPWESGSTNKQDGIITRN